MSWCLPSFFSFSVKKKKIKKICSITERESGSRNFYQDLLRREKRAGRLRRAAPDGRRREDPGQEPPQLFRGQSWLKPLMVRQNMKLTGSCFHPRSPSTKQPVWWASSPTSTSSSTMACVFAAMRVSPQHSHKHKRDIERESETSSSAGHITCVWSQTQRSLCHPEWETDISHRSCANKDTQAESNKKVP